MCVCVCARPLSSMSLELWSYGAFYSITTFIGGMSPPLQIRQVARLMEHHMQPAGQSPTREEHTNNPVQKPNFRGHAGTKARTRKKERRATKVCYLASGAMELWSSLLNHHLHERDNTSFADPAGCSADGALHAITTFIGDMGPVWSYGALYQVLLYYLLQLEW